MKTRKPNKPAGRLVRCPLCGADHRTTAEVGDFAWNHCEGCLDREHIKYVRRMAKLGIFPYGKAYAEKVGA